MTQIIPEIDPQALPGAVTLLNDGKAVAFPTETVYGLGVKTMVPRAIDQLYRIKGRDEGKAITIMLPNQAALDAFAVNIPGYAREFARAFWPGALTLIFTRHPDLPAAFFPKPTIGIRIPDHPFVQALLAACGPLAVTSANLSGQPSAVNAQQVFEQLQGRIPLLIDGGACQGGTASTVVDCTGDTYKILRPGAISEETLKSVV
jgi:L-threonylcarbamoyladenylate synthase